MKKAALVALFLLTIQADAQGVIETFAGTEFLFPANRRSPLFFLPAWDLPSSILKERSLALRIPHT